MTTVNTSLAIVLTLAATTMLAGMQTSDKPAGRAESGSSPPADMVVIVDSSFPTVTVDLGQQIHGTVFLGNPSRAPRDVSLSIGLRSALGRRIDVKPADVVIDEKGGDTVAPSTPLHGLPFTVTLPALSPDEFPLSGWLAVTTASSSQEPNAPDSVPRGKVIEIKAIVGRSSGADWPLLWRSFLAAALATLLAAFVAVRRDGRGVLIHRMGGPTWSFTDSWSSTLTVAGAMFTSVVSFTGLPEQGHLLSKRTYGILSLALVGIIGLAPGVYNVFRKAVIHTNDAGASVVQYQGFVLLFLVAAIFTITGVVAQLGVLRMLFDDVATANVLSTQSAEAFGVLFRGLQVLLLIYATVSIAQTLHSQSAPAERPAGAKPAAVRANALEQSLPDWSLL